MVPCRMLNWFMCLTHCCLIVKYVSVLQVFHDSNFMCFNKILHNIDGFIKTIKQLFCALDIISLPSIKLSFHLYVLLAPFYPYKESCFPFLLTSLSVINTCVVTILFVL